MDCFHKRAARPQIFRLPVGSVEFLRRRRGMSKNQTRPVFDFFLYGSRQGAFGFFAVRRGRRTFFLAER